MFIGYWHKEGLEIYRLTEGKIVKFASGKPEMLNPVRAMGRKVLIIGRDLLFHSRKKFPPASESDIRKAVQLEVGDLFPVKDPGHSMSIFERTEAYTAVDIWAWDSSGIEVLKKTFPFTHIVPEDSAFVSGDPEISVMEGKEETCILAHAKEGFIAKATFRGEADAGRIRIFLKSLGRHADTIKRMNVYDGSVLSPTADLPFPVVRKEKKDYPPCLEYIAGVDLRRFKAQGEPVIEAYAGITMRAVIYLFLAYGISLFITGMNYDAASREVKTKISKLSVGVAAVSPGQGKEDFSDVIAELKEKFKGAPTPLGIMDLLAKQLPEQSSIVRMTLNDNSLELALTSKDALKVLKTLSGAPGVKSVKLRGAPYKDSKGIYTFNLVMEFI